MLPADVATSAFGPRFEAAVAVLSVRNRASRCDVVELAEELFGARLCAGTVEAILARAARALEDPYEDLGERVRASESLNMDETGWRTAGERRALWGMFTSRHAVFHLATDRHEDHAKSLLTDTEAIVTSDRWWAYAHLPTSRRQICWSHLRRDFQAHAEGLAAEKEFGEAGLQLCERVFWEWEVFAHTQDRREHLEAGHPLLRRQASAQPPLPWHGAQPAEALAGAVPANYHQIVLAGAHCNRRIDARLLRGVGAHVVHVNAHGGGGRAAAAGGGRHLYR